MKTFREIKAQVTDTSYKNPLRLIFFVTITIFAVEAGIMEFLSRVMNISHIAGSILDAVILVSAVLPVLYFFFYRPFSRQVADLQRSEQDLVRFATAIEQGKDAIIMTDADGVIEYVNPAFHWITGYPWEEAVGKKPSILKSGKHDDAFYQNIWNTLRRGEMWEGEIINRHKDGNTYYASSRITPVRDVGGNIVNYVSVMEDITLQKLAEAEKTSYLRRMEELSRYNMNLVEKAPIGAWVVNFVPLRPEDETRDPCHRWHKEIGAKIVTERVNNAMVEMLGYGKLDIVGRSIFDPALVDDENALIFANEIKRRRGGERGSYDVEINHRLGGKVHMLVEAVPILVDPESGKPLQSLGIFVNLTDRKKMEDKIVQLMMEQQIILHTSPIGIALLVSRKIQWLNAALCKITGYAELELRGSLADRLYPSEEDFKDSGIQSNAIIGRGDTYEVERPMRRKDGSLFQARIIATAIDPSELQRGVIFIMEDISERKGREQEREAFIEALNRSNEELKEFAYIVSHDLKAPLRAIGSLAEWISHDYADKLDEEGRENLALLLGRTKRMNALIEGILRYSRLGRLKPERDNLDANRIAGLVIGALAPPENITVRVEGTLPTVVYDRTHLEQLFQNLISNAIKHLGKPTGEVVISCRDADAMWEFCVRDTGQGIEEKHHERIFKIFQSLKPRDELESTGIGLTLVKKIVENNGGTVWITSAVGSGSEFHFTIPKTPAVDRDDTERILTQYLAKHLKEEKR
ncbi:MAG: PAS domain S-box protein [Nitrospinae bacterium]|nr:PAS domain S-box protein [Nitrospinota bacterium]